MHMPRAQFTCNPERPYHITARCINKDWFGMSMDEVWSIMEDYLYFINKAYFIEIYSFVLMKNHFHLIARSPEANLSEGMAYFMRQTSLMITKSTGRINQTYGSRFFRSLIDSDHHFSTVYKYVYRNPVEAFVVHNVEDYRYSTLNGLLGLSRMGVPVVEDTLLFSGIDKNLQWLNRAPRVEDLDLVRKALRRNIFKLPRCETNKKPHRLNAEFY